MYQLITEASFDSAHFLLGYQGKCSNIHGHRWRVVAEIERETLEKSGQLRGMMVDFSDFKKAMKELVDTFDHALIIESGSLKSGTLSALYEENFEVKEVPFRPTAEEFAQYFYNCLSEKGYPVKCMTVYETPNNCASYSKEVVAYV